MNTPDDNQLSLFSTPELPLKSSFCDWEIDSRGYENSIEISGYEPTENKASKLQINDNTNTKCSDTWISFQESEDSHWQQNSSEEYRQLSLLKSTPTLRQSCDRNSWEYQFTQTSETTTQNQDNLTSLAVDSPVLAHQMQGVERDYSIQLPLFGEKDLDVLSKLNPAFVLSNNSHGVIRRGLRAILGGLNLAGYATEIGYVSAAELGAGHQRLRLFIISYPDEQRILYQQTCWTNQMRSLVQRQRANQEWLTVRNTSDRSDNGLSVGVVRGSNRTILKESDYTEPSKTPGRIRARYLAGRTVTPAQAAVALRRVLMRSGIL